MLGLSYFIPLLAVINAVKMRKRFTIFLQYILAFLINLLGLFFLYLLIKKYVNPDSFTYLGHIPFCNKKPERAFSVNGFVFPLCCRCLCFSVGAYMAILSWLVFEKNIHKRFWIISILLILPCLIDGMVQTFTAYESTNLKRSILGFLCGVGAGSIGYGVLYGLWNKKIKAVEK